MIEQTLDGLDHLATWHPDAAPLILIAFPLAMLAAYALGIARGWGRGAADLRRADAAREDAAALLAQVQDESATAREILARAKVDHDAAGEHLAAARANLKDAHAILDRQAAAIGVKEGDPIPDWAIAWAAQVWTTPANSGKVVDPSLATDIARLLVEAAVAGPPANLLTPKGGAA